MKIEENHSLFMGKQLMSHPLPAGESADIKKRIARKPDNGYPRTLDKLCSY